MSLPVSARYRGHVLAAVPRLLGTLDRDPHSPTHGSFDRDHWAWKFRDFPLTMLQTGMLPLATLFASAWPGNEYAGAPHLARWLAGAIEETLRRQRRNGAFDSVGPNTQDHGVTLAMTYTLGTTLSTLSGHLPGDVVRRVGDAMRRACGFAARSSEDYAFISNHHALFAMAWLRASQVLKDEALARRADRSVEGVLAHQSREGWYEEYGGPDPGYETLGVSYLAQFLVERPSEALRASLGRSVSFLSHFVHPDGSVGGAYGSRQTSLWFPAGVELLGEADPTAAAIARFVVDHVVGSPNGTGTVTNVVTPESTDIHNLSLLMYSYLVAAEAVDARERRVGRPDPALGVRLPCEALSGIKLFGESGLVVAGMPQYYAVFNGRRGGMGTVFGRSEGSGRFSDAGFVIQSGRRRWASGLGNAGEVNLGEEGRGKGKGERGMGEQALADREGPAAGATVMMRGGFGLERRTVITPFQFLVLRLLNLTLFRSVAIGAAIRRIIVRRLVTNRTGGPFTLQRQFRFEAGRTLISDVVRNVTRRPVEAVTRVSSYTTAHMGSARYFHSSELAEESASGGEDAAGALAGQGEWAGSMSIEFGADGRVIVTHDS